MKIGLFFGSFNPIHIGHLIIANLAYQLTDIKEVWFVISPQNPHKKNKSLLHEQDRLDMVRAAVYEEYHFRVSDIEFGLPKPNFTINTLAYLKERHLDHEFKLIIGEDNLVSFPRWKNYEEILNQFGLIVYPRPNPEKSTLIEHVNVEMIKAPIMDISASLIRLLIMKGKSIKYLVPDEVEKIIAMKGYYS